MAANPKADRMLPDKKQADEQLRAIVGRLELDAEDRVSKRQTVEERWLEDLAQYHGKYEEKIVSDLKKARKSTLYINATRAKTNAMEARLSDMLFPTDDKNWGIGPTPVPELTIEAEEAAKEAARTALAAAKDEDNAVAETQAANAHLRLVEIQSRMDEARKRAHAMEAEIDDHLTECNYSVQSRDVIADACKIGTGVFKGPVTDGRHRRSWQQDQVGTYAIVYGSDERPAYWRVDPWNFFPDSDASSMEDNEAVFERHMLNPKQLRALAKRAGFSKSAIRRLLMDQPKGTTPSYLSSLRTITGAYNDVKDRYHVWEYSGPLTAEDMTMLATSIGRPDMLDDLPEDVDPLLELNVVIWFCQGECLKFGVSLLDSGESLYSVFNLEKDEASLFGFGIPYIMRDPQKSLAAAWRTLMDNMGLSSGPQIVINDDVVEPVNGQWILEPRKVWRRKSTASPDKKPFEVFDIPSHMEELMAVIDVSKRNVDEETAMPMLAQGEQGTQVTKTAQGMSLLMNSVNVVFRRIVKNWDDNVTTPNIRRMYDWLMQFSPKEYIKGDYQVDARGTSVLLVREVQSANLMVLLGNFGAHPKYERFFKGDTVPTLRRLVQTMMLSSDEHIKSDAEIKEDDAKRAQQPPPPDPEMEKIAASMNLERMKGENAIQIELLRRETALMQIAANNNMKLEDVKAKLFDKQKDRDSKERMLAVEAAIEAKQAREGDNDKGSGGYIS